jgi:hypothetical protein
LVLIKIETTHKTGEGGKIKWGKAEGFIDILRNSLAEHNCDFMGL